ncbi:hypothetical protein [Streptomyces sp. NPDC048636]|uniref:hypothetical protein n=1 Tax=Streptomyces sp. NPDC048636 TaxID=3155762 RepID=UPI003449C540
MSNQPHNPQNPYEPHGPYGSPTTPYGGQQPPADPYGGYGQGGYDQTGYDQGGYDQAGQQPQPQQGQGQGYDGQWGQHGQHQGYGQHPQAYPDPYAAAPPGHQQQGHPQQSYTPGWDQQQPQQHHQPQPAAAFAAHGPQGPAAAPAATADPAGPEHPATAAPAAPEEESRPLTAAEKARAEGRPQILHPGPVPAVLTSAIAAALAGAASLGRPAVAVVVALLQAVTAAGWFRLNGMWPARQGIALAYAGGLAATAGLLATERVHAPTVIIGTLGVWLLLVLVLQLRSHSGPDERMYGLTATVASTALAVIAAGYLATAAESTDAVVVGAAGVAGAVLVRAVPLPIAVSVVVALVAAAGAGAGAGQLTGTGTTDAAVLGLAAGVCALIGHRVASYDYPSRFVHMTAGVALPLAAAAPVVYVIGRALV